MHNKLIPALRQFRHNDSGGFVSGYDMAIIDREFAALEADTAARVIDECAAMCERLAKGSMSAADCASAVRYLKVSVPAPLNRRLTGQMIYEAMYKNDGGKWTAVDDNHKPVWEQKAADLNAMLAASPTPAATPETNEETAFDNYARTYTPAATMPDGQAVKAACELCKGTGVVDDGEIDCYPNGEPYACGPVKCVKDCPRCASRAPASVGGDALDAARYRWLKENAVSGSLGFVDGGWIDPHTDQWDSGIDAAIAATPEAP